MIFFILNIGIICLLTLAILLYLTDKTENHNIDIKSINAKIYQERLEILIGQNLNAEQLEEAKIELGRDLLSKEEHTIKNYKENSSNLPIIIIACLGFIVMFAYYFNNYEPKMALRVEEFKKNPQMALDYQLEEFKTKALKGNLTDDKINEVVNVLASTGKFDDAILLNNKLIANNFANAKETNIILLAQKNNFQIDDLLEKALQEAINENKNHFQANVVYAMSDFYKQNIDLALERLENIDKNTLKEQDKEDLEFLIKQFKNEN